MQGRHAGGIEGFFELGLLRWLVAPSPYVYRPRLGVIWFGVTDESDDIDDRQLGYLDPSSAPGIDLRPLDAYLYDRLGRLVTSGDWSIRAVVSSGLLPANTVTYDRELTFADLSPNDRAGRVVRRERWFHDAMVAVDQCSLVFLDPDNGLRNDTRAAPPCRNDSEKHAYLFEVGKLIGRGQSVVVSHHANPCESAPRQAVAEMEGIHEALGVAPLAVVRAARGTTRMFVVIPAAGHVRISRLASARSSCRVGATNSACTDGRRPWSPSEGSGKRPGQRSDLTDRQATRSCVADRRRSETTDHDVSVTPSRSAKPPATTVVDTPELPVDGRSP